MTAWNPLPPGLGADPKRTFAAFLAAGVAVLGVAILFGRGGERAHLLLINESPSIPRGLYRRSLDPEPRPGRLAMVAQPAAARAYLAGLGVPAETRLLKRVAAVGGEGVCAQGGVLTTPRVAAATPAADRRGVALPVWRGCGPLAPDELLLLGDAPASFDGRYFGPVRRNAVEGIYEEVMRW